MTDLAIDTLVVEFSKVGQIAIITLNRPDQRNSVNSALTPKLRAAVERFEKVADLRVGILTGKGKVFCAGMDLKAYTSGEMSDDVMFGDGGFAGFVRLERTKPIIAAVNGAALAGGMELALACDMVIAEASTKFGLPEVRLGLVAGAGGIIRLATRIPLAKAVELVLTGKFFSADDALQYGLLNAVVEDGSVLAAAKELAANIAESAPMSVRDSLRILKAAQSMPDDQIWDFNSKLLAEIMQSQDGSEGVAAFAQKRRPNWSNA